MPDKHDQLIANAIRETLVQVGIQMTPSKTRGLGSEPAWTMIPAVPWMHKIDMIFDGTECWRVARAGDGDGPRFHLSEPDGVDKLLQYLRIAQILTAPQLTTLKRMLEQPEQEQV